MLVIPRLLLMGLVLLAAATRADTVAELEDKSLQSLAFLQQQAPETRQLLDDAAAVLVFPEIVKVGFGVGGQYGEGVLFIDGEADGYYSTAGASFGLQLGVEFKSEIIVFVSEPALRAFRSRRGFSVGIDADVVTVTPGTLAKLSTTEPGAEMLGFVLTNEGLMAKLSFEGAKITRLAR